MLTQPGVLLAGIKDGKKITTEVSESKTNGGGSGMTMVQIDSGMDNAKASRFVKKVGAYVRMHRRELKQSNG